MKRRQAIRNITLAATAVYLLPQCKHEPVATGPSYANIPIKAEQRQLLEQFTEALLPKAKTSVQTPEATTDFILTVLNDCTPPKDIEKYLEGLKELQSRVQQRYQTDFASLPDAQRTEVLAWLSGTDGLSDPLQFFYGKTRDLTIEHFTTSEFYLKTVRNWAFAPGYFKGCVAV